MRIIGTRNYTFALIHINARACDGYSRKMMPRLHNIGVHLLIIVSTVVNQKRYFFLFQRSRIIVFNSTALTLSVKHALVLCKRKKKRKEEKFSRCKRATKILYSCTQYIE
jgi:hypothetical protein